jgi:RimJ/RimL family protein N-acetyltransferase
MMLDLFRGKLVRLAKDEPEVLAKAYSRWDRDSEFRRLLDDRAAILWSSNKIAEWVKEDDESQKNIHFNLHTLEDDRLIGFISLFVVWKFQGDAWVGIGLGERKDWGKGYGTDAMQIILRYAFGELNLHRVSLGVHAYNPRAIRSYQKSGFVIEGVERKVVNREGTRHDAVIMGILREEWLAQHKIEGV